MAYLKNKNGLKVYVVVDRTPGSMPPLHFTLSDSEGRITVRELHEYRKLEEQGRIVENFDHPLPSPG